MYIEEVHHLPEVVQKELMTKLQEVRQEHTPRESRVSCDHVILSVVM